MTKRKLREHVFCTLYMNEFHQEEEMPEQIRLYFNDKFEKSRDAIDPSEEDKLVQLEQKQTQEQTEVEQMLQTITAKRAEIDEWISRCSEGWKLERMSKVDLTLLRVAVYEMVYNDEVPERVAINEAVELAKRYGGDHSYSFVNAILGKISRSRMGEENGRDS